MRSPRAICFMLLMQLAWRAFSRAWAKTGNRMAARMAMMAITTSNSMRVKPSLFFIIDLLAMMHGNGPMEPERRGRGARAHGRRGPRGEKELFYSNSRLGCAKYPAGRAGLGRA